MSVERPAASADQLWSVLDEMPARISYIDRGRRHRYVNREYAQLIGLPPSEILGRTVAEVLGEEEDAKLRAFAESAIQGETVRFEGWVEIPRGVDRYIHRVYKPHREDDGEVVGFFVLVRDSTEHQQAISEQRRLGQLMEDAIESTPSGFAVFDDTRRLALCNSAYADMFEVSVDDLIGATPEELLPRMLRQVVSIDGRPVADAGDSIEQYLKVFWSGDKRSIEAELKDGRWLLIDRHQTADGHTVLLRTDVTELKRMEQTVRESELLIRSVLESSPLPVAMTRAEDGTLIYESPASQKLFQRDEPRNRDMTGRDNFVDQAERRRFVAKLREEGALNNHELHLMRADGTEFWASVSARLAEYKGEEVIVSSALDLTERRAAEADTTRQREALYQSEKLNALGGLLAGVATNSTIPCRSPSARPCCCAMRRSTRRSSAVPTGSPTPPSAGRES